MSSDPPSFDPPSFHTVYIALGSNLGDRIRHLRTAIADLAHLGSLVAVSSFYETDPVGEVVQPDFVNAVAQLRTELRPEALMTKLLRLEVQHGRDRSHAPAKGPRTIDLDLLSFEDIVLDTPWLTLPHPAIAERAFVLVPLAEIAQNWRHPVTGKLIAQLLAELPQDAKSKRPGVRKTIKMQLPMQST